MEFVLNIIQYIFFYILIFKQAASLLDKMHLIVHFFIHRPIFLRIKMTPTLTLKIQDQNGNSEFQIWIVFVGFLIRLSR